LVPQLVSISTAVNAVKMFKVRFIVIVLL